MLGVRATCLASPEIAPAHLPLAASLSVITLDIEHRALFCTGEEIAGYDDDEVMDTLAAVRRLRARADAIEAHALTRLDELRDGSRYVPDEAALELRMSRHATADRVATARVLTDDMPQLLAAMESGQIERHPATKITNAVTHLTGPQRREVDQQLADKLATGKLSWLDPSRLVRAARRLVTKVDPDGQTDRARRARVERKVELIPGEDSMSTLAAELPAEVAASAYSRIDGMARRLRNNGDERTLDQLRADVYADLLLGNDPGTMPGCHRPAQRCDFDHLGEWQHHPGTSSGNGAPKCKYHHTMKSEPDWHIDYDPETGTTTVTTPSGRSYQHQPRPPRPTGVDTEATADKTPSPTPDNPPF